MNSDEELITIFNDFFNEEAIENIEINIKFFRDIPKDRLIDVFICLTEKLHQYDVHNQEKQFTSMINEYLQIYKQKPSIKLKQDIETIKKFKEVFSRITSFTDIEKEVPNLNSTLNKVLHDLETKEFNIISRQKYYRPKEVSKTEMRDFLKSIREHFSLKGVSLEEKQILDSFISYIKTKE